MASIIYGFIALTGGGTGALDRAELDGSILIDKDMAEGVVGGYKHVYDLVAASGATADGVRVIAPPNAGAKRWVLRGMYTPEIVFDTAPTVGDFAEGKLYYDALWHTLSLMCGRDNTLQMGMEEWRRVYNATGSQINNGQPVYTNGVYVTTEPYVATVALAQANSSSTYWVLGLATQNIPTGGWGNITVRGHVNDVDTSAFSNGDVLYLSADTAGVLTNVAPEAPNYKVRIGRVVYAATAENHGVINVRLLAANRLQDLADVQAPSPVAGQVLKFTGVSWIPSDTATVASAGGTDFYLTDQEIAIQGMTRAAACVVSWTGHGLATGAYVQFTGITQAEWTALNWTLANGLFHKITWINADSFSIAVNTSGYAADYNAAVDNGTISSGKIPNVPDTTISETIDSAQSTGSVEALIDTYSTAVLNRTSIEAGLWDFKTWCYASSTTDTNTIVIRVYKRNTAGTETQLFTVETADLSTTNTLSQISSAQPAHALDATDHLVIKYFAKSTRGGGAYRTLYLTHNGTDHYSFVRTPLSLLHDQLGGLNAGAYQHLSSAEKTAATRSATSSQSGLATSTQITKLDGIEALADVTDATNVAAAGAVMEGDYAAYSILAADTVDVPQAIELAASQLIGRKSTGGIVALAKADLQTIINVADGATATPLTTKIDDFGVCGTSDTTKDANTTNHGLLLKAVAPASPLTNVIAIENGETVYKLKALYDTTHPEALGTATEGTAATAARRDHVHALPTLLTDGDKGDITVGGTGTTLTIEANAVTLAKLATQAADTVLANVTSGAAVPTAYAVDEQEVLGRITGGRLTGLTATQIRTLINVADGSQANASGGTLTTLLNLGENAGLQLDTVLSQDEKWSGITQVGTLGATIAVGDLCYLAPADSRWELADADAQATCWGILGLCLIAGNDGSASEFLLWGKMRSAAFPSFTVNGAVFVSGTAGDVTHTAPTGTTDVVRVVGFALTAEDLFFCPSNDILELT